MRRVIAILAALTLPLAFAAHASAADKVYVQLNEEGIKQALVKKAYGPPWLGKVVNPIVKVEMTGVKPMECTTKGTVIKGMKSSSYGYSFMEFAQSKAGHYMDFQQWLYQYPNGEDAFAAWTDLLDKAKGCAGTHTHTVYDEQNQELVTFQVKITVFEGLPQYGYNSLVINEDVLVTSELASGAKYKDASDEISIWRFDGNAITESELNKFVPKYKKWVFSEAQIATIETLSFLAMQRYHLAAYKSV